MDEPSELQCIIKRDIVFGPNIITDFEYEFRGHLEAMKPLPVCPCCGKKRFEQVN